MRKILFFAFVLIISASCSNNTFKDKRDNKVYKTIRIGNKIWMAENLNYNLDNQGSYFYPKRMLDIDSATLKEALDFYNIDLKPNSGLCDLNVLKKFNPKLDTVMKRYPEGWRYYTSTAAKMACPEGWRIPNNGDWIELNKYSNTKEFAELSFDFLSWWKKNYDNQILEIRLGDYFGDERGCSYWSSSETSLEFCLAVIDDKTISINPQRIGDEKDEAAFSIRCVKDVD